MATDELWDSFWEMLSWPGWANMEDQMPKHGPGGRHIPPKKTKNKTTGKKRHG